MSVCGADDLYIDGVGKRNWERFWQTQWKIYAGKEYDQQHNPILLYIFNSDSIVQYDSFKDCLVLFD